MHDPQDARNMCLLKVSSLHWFQAPSLEEKHGREKNKRKSKLQNLWWQKSKFIKLRWGSLLELELYDQTKCLSFYPKFHNGLLWTPSKKQLRICKQAVHLHDPEKITKAAKIYYTILSTAFLLSDYPIPTYRGECVAHKEAENSEKKITISDKWKSHVKKVFR